MITKATASEIWRAYDEIERAQKLLEEARLVADRNPFEKTYRRVEMGIPCGESSMRILDVSPGLARGVIEAHVAECRSRLVALALKAKAELEGGAA